MRTGRWWLAGLLVLAATMLTLLTAEANAEGVHWRLLSLSDSIDHDILLRLRVPRALTALLVGAALAVAGVALQGLLRNPLAEPFTLGISSSSSLAAVIAIRIGFASGAAVHVSAMLGALLAVWIVWRMARSQAGLPPATLLLAGITLTTWAAAASMLVQHTASFVEMAAMVRWMMGSLHNVAGYDALQLGALPLAAAGLVVMWHRDDLNAMTMGHDVAAGVGVDVRRTSTRIFVAASVLVGGAIALAGPVGFVGLMVPHLCRGLVGANHRRLLPWSTFVGGIGLVICDGLARLVLAPDQLAVGILTALLGGPFFVAMLIREKRQSALWLPR